MPAGHIYFLSGLQITEFHFLQFSIHTEIHADKADGKSYMKQPVCFFFLNELMDCKY
jgi:hypothetical protein